MEEGKWGLWSDDRKSRKKPLRSQVYLLLYNKPPPNLMIWKNSHLLFLKSLQADLGRVHSYVYRQLGGRVGAGWCRMALARMIHFSSIYLSYLPSILACICSHNTSRDEERKQNSSTFSKLCCIEFVLNSLTKASHMTKLRISLQEHYYQRVWIERDMKGWGHWFSLSHQERRKKF